RERCARPGDGGLPRREPRTTRVADRLEAARARPRPPRRERRPQAFRWPERPWRRRLGARRSRPRALAHPRRAGGHPERRTAPARPGPTDEAPRLLAPAPLVIPGSATWADQSGSRLAAMAAAKRFPNRQYIAEVRPEAELLEPGAVGSATYRLAGRV